jgi:enoyl-CoA hydratase/carnithine racemase
VTTSLEALRVEVDGGVAWVRLDRPERLNALDTALQHRVVETFCRLDADDSVAVVVLGSTSPRAFSVGADLKEKFEAVDGVQPTLDPMRHATRNVFETVLECRKPTIAALQGWVVGGGMELAMACDMRIAASSARFRMPEGRVGLAANFGSQMLPRLVPRAHAFDILYRAETFDAMHAAEIGFVSQVCDPEALDEVVGSIAGAIAARAPLTLRRFKAMVTVGASLPIATAIRLDPGPSPYTSEDRREGAAAFAEGREPRWIGR